MVHILKRDQYLSKLFMGRFFPFNDLSGPRKDVIRRKMLGWRNANSGRDCIERLIENLFIHCESNIWERLIGNSLLSVMQSKKSKTVDCIGNVESSARTQHTQISNSSGVKKIICVTRDRWNFIVRQFCSTLFHPVHVPYVFSVLIQHFEIHIPGGEIMGQKVHRNKRESIHNCRWNIYIIGSLYFTSHFHQRSILAKWHQIYSIRSASVAACGGACVEKRGHSLGLILSEFVNLRWKSNNFLE